MSPLDPSSIDAVLNAAVADGDVPGVVAAVTDERDVIYEGAFGLAATRLAHPMRLESVFRIASMTKLVTSVGLMMLQEEGRVDLDDPLAHHLPGYVQPPVLASFDPKTRGYTTRPAQRAATLRQLLSHTSGYGYWFLSRELRAVLGDDASHFEAPFLLHEPGERFTYGIGTDVLGKLFLPVTGSPLETFFEERIFGPLGMTSTSFSLPGDPERLTALHVRDGQGFTDRPNETRAGLPRGGGGLYSTAADYLALLRLFLNGGLRPHGVRLLEDETLAHITRNQIGELFASWQATAAPRRTLDFQILDGTQKFGLGVVVETRPRPGGRPAGSYGWGGINNTFFWVDPEARLAGVILMQMSPFCDARCMDVYRRFEQAVYGAGARPAALL